MGLAEQLTKHKPPYWVPRPGVLLADPIPMALWGTAPRTVLGEEWWTKTKGEALRSTDYHCIACKIAQVNLIYKSAIQSYRLSGHEVYETDYLLGRMYYKETVPLCPACHYFIHKGFLAVQVLKGNLTSEYAADVVAHGNSVLRNAGLSLPARVRYPDLEWEEWRLVIGEKEYKPRYRSLEHFMSENK